MEDLNNNKRPNQILIYALVGISGFVFWYLTMAFILADFNPFVWEDRHRAVLMLLVIFTIFMNIVTYELNK